MGAGAEDDPVRLSERRAGTPPLRTIRIFLASSSELQEDRDAFDLHVRQRNDRLVERGIYLKIERWETCLDAISDSGLQNTYNNAVKNCDIFVSLFKTKTGRYTEEEFDVAHKAFQDCGKPLIYTYFMGTDVPADRRLREDLTSLWAFQDKLNTLKHYHTTYANMADLKLKFQQQLEELIETGRLWS